MSDGPKIITLDVENSAILGDFWSGGKTYIGKHNVRRPSFLFSWAGKWLGEEEVIWDALPWHPDVYADDMENDYAVVKSVRDIIDEADIIIGHNVRRFDLRKIVSRMMLHGIEPFAYPLVIDTLTLARATVLEPFNTLAWLSEHFCCGGKMEHEGHALWEKCEVGDMNAWRTMVDYNKQDVVTGENFYLKIRPYARTLPNLSLFFSDGILRCKACAAELAVRDTDYILKGYKYTNAGKYRRYGCLHCGFRNNYGWKNLVSPEAKEGHVR